MLQTLGSYDGVLPALKPTAHIRIANRKRSLGCNGLMAYELMLRHAVGSDGGYKYESEGKYTNGGFHSSYSFEPSLELNIETLYKTQYSLV